MPPPPNNVTFATGSNPQSVELNEENGHNDSLMDQMLGVITDLFNTAKDNFNDVLKCPGGQRRGWKILDGNSPVEFAPCGCYDDALWPLLLGIPAAAKAGATAASKVLVKKARRKWSRVAIQKSMDLMESLESEYVKAFKGLKSNILELKLPPVKPGYRRLYRGQGVKTRFDVLFDGQTPVKVLPTGDLLGEPVLNLDNPKFAGSPTGGYWYDDIFSADADSRNFNNRATNESEVFYIDIPEADLDKANISSSNRGTINNIGMLPGQRHADQVPGIIREPGEAGWKFPTDAIMPLRRRNADGVIEIVEDVPNAASDLQLNPGVFTELHKSQMVHYLDSPINNTNYLDQVTRESGLAAQSKELAFQKLKKQTQELWRKQHELKSALDNQDTLPQALQDMVPEIEDSGKKLVEEIDKLFDTYEYITGDVFDNLKEKTFTWSAYLKEFLPWFLGLLAFIDQVMSLVSIVKDKSCIPLMEGGLSEFSNKDQMTQIRNQRIGAKASVWAELNKETCECSECPEDWNFCDHSSITNLYLKETNSCIPPCCGDQEFKPITLISTCKCDCPPDKVWMPCKSSDCTQSDSLLTSIFNPSSPGKCVDPNPDPEKLEWDDETCEWKCKIAVEAHAPNPVSAWIFPPKTPIKPCKANSVRLPPLCECSGSYSDEAFNPLLNITTINSIRLL